MTTQAGRPREALLNAGFRFSAMGDEKKRLIAQRLSLQLLGSSLIVTLGFRIGVCNGCGATAAEPAAETGARIGAGQLITTDEAVR